MNITTGYIIGAYPCAPSFHQKSEEEEKEFWRQLADTPDIRGIEQPCLEHIHPLGDEWLLRHTPDNWQIVITAIMETMRRRGENAGFGLASSDEQQRVACVEYYRHLHRKINKINGIQPGKVTALELQAAPLAGDQNIAQATDAFSRSLKETGRADVFRHHPNRRIWRMAGFTRAVCPLLPAKPDDRAACPRYFRLRRRRIVAVRRY